MTLLSQQLQKLTLPQDHIRSGSVRHSSLIFTSRVASDHDIEEIFDIGINGLEELISLNPVFEQYKETLFHSSAIKFERLVKSAEFLIVVDKSIESFLAHVCDYSLLTASCKALEWLVRAFKIHLYNSKIWLEAFLPVHDTKIFPKILEIIHLPENWTWLQKAKSNTSLLTKDDIVQMCVAYPEYLTSFVETSMKMISLTDNKSKVHLSFLVSLVFLSLEKFDTVPADIVPRLYMCVQKTISCTDKNVKSGGYIMVGQLVRKLTLKAEIVTQLIETICQHPDSTLQEELVMVLLSVVYHQDLKLLPTCCTDLLISDTFLLAVEIVDTKNDVSTLLKSLVMSLVRQVFQKKYVDSKNILEVFKIKNFPDNIGRDVCNLYFELYFVADDKIRNLPVIKKLGSLLAECFTKQTEDTFQSYEISGKNVDVLEKLKHLIIGTFADNIIDKEVLQMHHSLPGIRMLGILKLSEKMQNGRKLTPDEQSVYITTIIARLEDNNNDVFLKSLELSKSFTDIANDKILKAVISKICDVCDDVTSDKSVLPKTVSILSLFSPSEDVGVAMTYIALNYIPYLVKSDVKIDFLSTLMSSHYSHLQKIGSVLSGNDVTQYSSLANILYKHDLVIQCLVEYPTKEGYKILCLLALEQPSSLTTEGRAYVLDNLLHFVTISNQRKIEYREMKTSTECVVLKDLLYNKGNKLFRQFAMVKRDWEVLYLVLGTLKHLAPHIKNTDKLKDLLLALASVPAPWSPICGEVVSMCDVDLIYTVLMEIVMVADPVFSKIELKVTLKHIKSVVCQPSNWNTPILLCILVSPNKSVRKWCRVLMKNTKTKDRVLALIIPKLSKSQDKFQIQQIIKEACEECSDSKSVSRLIKDVYSSNLYFHPLLTLFYAVQHEDKLEALFNIISSSAGPLPDNLIGKFDSTTASMISQSDTLRLKYRQCLEKNILMLETLTPEFIGSLSPDFAQDIITSVINRVETFQEHTRVNVKQALFSQSSAVIRPVLILLLKEHENIPVVTFCLEIAAVQKDPELSGPLFDVLSKMLSLESEDSLNCVEFVITALTHTCDIHGKNAPVTSERIQQIVQLIRDSAKPSLHHQCLILLSKLARHFPKLILDHVMSIFTFMGDSTLRRDDNYSIQVVLETISTVIPVVSKRRDMVDIVRVFCDTLPQIPSHRQEAVFKLLLETVGPDVHLANVFLFVLEYCSRERDESSQCSHFLQSLSTHFTLSQLLSTSSILIECLFYLPDKLDTSLAQKQYKVSTKHGIELQYTDIRHYNYFRLGLATQIYLMVCAKSLSTQISNVGPEDEKKLVHLIETSLSILIHQSAVVSPLSAKFSEMYCKRLSGIISSITLTLPPSLFISVIKALLSTNTPLIHTKSLDILTTRAKSGGSAWSPEFEDSIVSLCPLLLELTSTQPLAWATLQHTANKIGSRHPACFLTVLSKGVSELGLVEGVSQSTEGLSQSTEGVSVNLEGVYGCVEECIRQLGPRAVPHLKPLVTQSLQNLKYSVQLLKSIVECLPQFLSPHVKDIIVAASLNWSDSLKDLMRMLGENIHLRVLLLALHKTTEEINTKDPHSLYGVLETCTVALQVNTPAKIKGHLPVLGDLYTKLLSYRHLVSSPQIEIENCVVKSFVVLTYKLTEKEFLPLLTQLVQWSEGHPDKGIAFYHLCTELADQLKGLFILFAGYIFNNLVDHLKDLAPLKPNQEGPEVKRVKVTVDNTLLKYTLSTTHKILMYDNKGFTTPERFHSLLEPLSSQLIFPEREDYRTLVTDHVTPALSHLPIAANSDTLWKHFNYHILSLSKNDSPKIRISVLTVYSEFVAKLGQDISSLLPDTLPFLSELLEDPDPEVERMSEEIVKKIEKITGESLDQYL